MPRSPELISGAVREIAGGWDAWGGGVAYKPCRAAVSAAVTYHFTVLHQA
jgi:hypothetical protein